MSPLIPGPLFKVMVIAVVVVVIYSLLKISHVVQVS